MTGDEWRLLAGCCCTGCKNEAERATTSAAAVAVSFVVVAAAAGCEMPPPAAAMLSLLHTAACVLFAAGARGVPIQLNEGTSNVVLVGGFVPMVPPPAVATGASGNAPSVLPAAVALPNIVAPPPIFPGEFPNNPMPHPLVIEVTTQEDMLDPSLKRLRLRNPRLLQAMSYSTLLGPYERVEVVRDSDVMPREAVLKMLKNAGFI